MTRLNQIAFALTLLALSWFLMMAIHEFGHVVGAIVTGGSVQRLVLHPLSISRTDVSPNPNPAVVVWLGPILGSLLPLFPWWLVPNGQRDRTLKNLCLFFAGFCLIANGAYIGIGALERIGDCREMLRTGSPIWTLVLFGAVSAFTGLFVWHRMGSPGEFFKTPESVSAKWTLALIATLVVLVGLEFVLSPV